MSRAVDTLYRRATGTAWSWRWLVVADTLAVVVLAPTFTVFGDPGGGPRTGPAAAALPLAAAALVLQIRNGLAIADGRRPRAAQWSVLALALLSYMPLVWFGWNWSSLQGCVLASLPLVLTGRWLVIAIALPIIGTDIAVVLTGSSYPGTDIAFTIFYETMTLLATAASLYGAARLVRIVDELRGARTELAAMAVARERLRVSRDLHDLLGQSLSAIALKGDLAMRLLSRDITAARAEVDGVASLARDALRGIHAISRDEHTVSVAVEAEGAVALLSAAGVDARVDLNLSDVDPAVEHVVAWGIREGVANTLRHSRAQVCWITGGHRGGNVFVEVLNDGAPESDGDGTGLAGLSERARALSGSVAARHLPGSWFSLVIQVPE